MTDYSASTTLDDIINELRLSYDSSVGLLGGDHVQEVPKVSILLNLSKLLNKLNKQLQEVERTDIEVLERIVDEIGDEEAGDNGEANVTVDGDIEGKEMDQGEVVEGEEEYAVEVGKEENEGEEDEHDGMVTEDVTQDGGIEKNEGETDADNILRMKRKSNESLDTDDEDDVGLAKRRKFSKQEETSDKIDGPAISIDGAQNNNEKEREEVEGSAHGEGEDNDDDEGEGAEEEDGEEEDEEDEEGDEDNEDVDEDGNKINGDDDDEEEEEPPRFDGNGDIIPPEQKGHYTQDNDTRLKNPKSEFVTSQTLPAEAIAKLGLFSEDHNGLETQGKEYLKKKYGVASYPENDLYDLLPGPIPNIDFSKNKPPTNQVQFTTFQSYIESYFRPFVPEDIDFLREKTVLPSLQGFDSKSGYDAQVTPFLIPKLGPFYADVWTAEDLTLAAKLNTPSYIQPGPDNYLPKGSIDNLNDEKLYTEDISCGPLSSRLLSAILCNNDSGELDDTENNHNNNGGDIKMEVDDELTSSPVPQPGSGSVLGNDFDVATQLNLNTDTYKVSSEKSDFHSIEERLKRELKYIGIFMNLPNGGKDEQSASSTDQQTDPSGAGVEGEVEGEKKKITGNIIDNDDWIKNREDDEVCAEIRALQRELQEVSARNRQHKKKLIPIVEEQLAYQEYCTILEDLDKQVDQAYIKRLRVKNKKKKSATTGSTDSPAPPSVNSGLRSLLDKRSKWLNNIGKLFKSPELMKRAPTESILLGGDDSDDELENEDLVDAADSIMNK